MVKKYDELYLQTRRALKDTEGENAAACAWQLLCAASGKSQAELIAKRELYASEQIEQELQRALGQFLREKPLAYITGTQSFYGMELTVTPDVLIPRDDTMAVTELAISRLQKQESPQRVLDLCTGSGCIGLAVAKQVPTARVTLCDISEPALAVAKQNVQAHHLTGRVRCMSGDAMQPPPAFWGQFDLIVSNPPYVTKEELEKLPPSVREYEPLLALDGGEDGLDFYRAIAENYLSALKPFGWLCMEFGMGQEMAVGTILERAGLDDIGFRRDWRGVIRAVCARKKFL